MCPESRLQSLMKKNAPPFGENSREIEEKFSRDSILLKEEFCETETETENYV